MLQQTRVETVIPYFLEWMQRFPTILSLAAASEQEVLSQWEGLGYYSRARNLHRAAKILVAEYGGQLPGNVPELLKLPGIGKYTAGAIASIAFHSDAAALDGNIRRVLSRLVDLDLPADDTEGEIKLWEIARQNLPPGRAGDYNQALMDLGALICHSRSPECSLCPLGKICVAHRNGTQEERPVLKPRTAIPHYVVAAAVIFRDGLVLLAQRPKDKLLGGMWEFPGGKMEEGETLAKCLRREIREELDTTIRVGKEIGIYQHAYTHFSITVHAYVCKITGKHPRAVEVAALAWVSAREMKAYPMGKVDRLIANQIAEDLSTISA